MSKVDRHGRPYLDEKCLHCGHALVKVGDIPAKDHIAEIGYCGRCGWRGLI